MSENNKEEDSISIPAEEEDYGITIYDKNTDKFLKLDMNTDKIITSGSLKYDEGAKIFFESLGKEFQKAITNQVNKKLKEIKENE